LRELDDCSIDAVVTDPPYELGFMGKKWDSSGIAFNVEVWLECLRVLKPGGHLLAFSGTRTYHRMTVAIEDAGFEVRDMIAWISNKTFPKSQNISKAIDKAAGAEREVIGSQKLTGNAAQTTKEKGGTFASSNINSIGVEPIEVPLTAPATDEARQWDGWGTALKPSLEPVVMARKPLIGTVAENVLAHGTGGLNIDGTRIAYVDDVNLDAVHRQQANNPIRFGGAKPGDVVQMYKPGGRWPSNVMLDEFTAGLVDEKGGTSTSHRALKGTRTTAGSHEGYKRASDEGFESVRGYDDSGGVSRFFYVARASKTDRNEGTSRNFHPTVKPTDLMRQLVRLVTPPGGIVLDPFTGSGSTGKAAILEGFQFVGCELTEDYLPIIEGRIKYAIKQLESIRLEAEAKESEQLF
jgi:site-specific DNA-methyltransferase (adenine-specific)